MKEEIALMKVSENKFSLWLNNIKNFFFKLGSKSKQQQKTSEVSEVRSVEEQKINVVDDLECLEGILSGKINIRDLDKYRKKRLIKLCDNRLEEVRKEIEKKERQIAYAQEILQRISNM